MEKTVILTPTYNERANIQYLVPELFSRYPKVYVVVIDDNSPDGTANAVEEMMKQYPNLGVLKREGKLGLGAAYKAGMEAVLEDPEVAAIITMDADGSHDPEYVGALMEAGKASDLVVGSRYIKGGNIENWEMWRFLLSRYGNLYAHTITGLPLKDMTAGFMHINADLLRQVEFSSMRASGYAFLMELKYILTKKLGGSVVEVPIIFKSRREGESKISGHIIREGLATPWRIIFKK